MKVFFKTFGCRTNIYDTQVMIASLGAHELAFSESEADAIVVNSCTVTNGADKDVKDYIAKIRKLNKKVLFTGCAANSLGREMFENGRIFGVFGHSQKENIADLLAQRRGFSLRNDTSHIDSTIISHFVGKSRAFIKVQEGCDFKCSYCIIPQVRGHARSYPRENILEQIRALAGNGVSEVVLSGTNLGSYGKDTRDTLPKLLCEIARISGIKRIRLGSLESSQIKEDFLEILDGGFLEKHLHIAIQHTDNEMLRTMRRINRYERDLRLFEKIAGKGFAIGTDFIVAHPNESEAIFERAVGNLAAMPLTHIHAFIYSPRENTASAAMPQSTPRHIAKMRLARIREIISEKNRHFRRTKPSLEILVERKKDEYFYGLDQFFNRIKIKSDENLALQWLKISDYDIHEDMNYAEI